jgi:hypothetical protein
MIAQASDEPGVAQRGAHEAGIEVAPITGRTALGRHSGRLTKTSRAACTTDGRRRASRHALYAIRCWNCGERPRRTGLRPAPSCLPVHHGCPIDCREEVFRITHTTHEQHTDAHQTANARGTSATVGDQTGGALSMASASVSIISKQIFRAPPCLVTSMCPEARSDTPEESIAVASRRFTTTVRDPLSTAARIASRSPRSPTLAVSVPVIRRMVIVPSTRAWIVIRLRDKEETRNQESWTMTISRWRSWRSAVCHCTRIGLW